MTPEEAARARLQALDALQKERNGLVASMGEELYEAILDRLQELLDDPTLLGPILQDFTNNRTLPFVLILAEQLLDLPELQQRYYEALGVEANFLPIRRPMDATLRQWFGIDAEGGLVADGFLAGLAADTSAARELTTFAYQANLSGMGLTEYRAGLKALILGSHNGPQGVYQRLYDRAGDTFAQADRLLQLQAGERLGFSAYLYQGGLIESSRPFCRARNGKVWLASEIEKWASLSFQGKPTPYDPWTMLGGYRCRHSLNGLPNTVAISLRPDLKEDANGKLYAA